MSFPVGDLLKALSAQQKMKGGDGKLVNPDIPERDVSASNIAATRDKFYSAMRLDSLPRNGDGYTLSRAPGLPNLDPRKQEFMLDGSIDPANKRHRHTPLAAPPNSYAEGAEDFLYQLGKSTRESKASIALMQRARQSYANRLNRLQPISIPVSIRP